MTNNGEVGSRPFLLPGDDESHEQRPGELGSGTGTQRTRQKPAQITTIRHDRNKPDPAWPQHHSQSTTNSHLDQVCGCLFNSYHLCNITQVSLKIVCSL